MGTLKGHMSEERKPGEISLSGIFAAAADDLLAAVAQGRILHKSRNIRDSGAPLEAAVRAFFSRLLPQSFSVSHGYLFDTQSKCTPQIDLIISPTPRSHAMLRAPEGATYSPFTDVYAIGEVKASARGMSGHLDQFGTQIRSVTNMWRALAAHGGHLPELTTFIITGESEDVKDSDITDYWKANSDIFPNYIVMLSCGEIVMSTSGLFALFDDSDDEVTPIHQPAGNRLAAFAAGTDLAEKRGNALLWLFYAILHRLRLSEARELRHALSEVAANEEASWHSGARKAADMLSRAADPFSAAMIRNVKLKRTRILSDRS